MSSQPAIAALHPILAWTIHSAAGNPYYRALIEHGLIHSVWGIADQIVLLIAFGALGLAMCTRSLLDRWLYFGLAMQAVVCMVLLPALGHVLQGPIKALAQSASQVPTVSFQLRAPSFSFYRRALTDERLPQLGEQVVLRAADFSDLHRATGEGTEWVLVDGAGPLLLLKRQ